VQKLPKLSIPSIVRKLLGLLAESKLVAIKRIIAMELAQTLSRDEDKLTKTALADRIGTSRAGVDRLLDPQNTSVTLHTLARAAKAIGKTLHVSLV
jgi:antitoxin HicB